MRNSICWNFCGLVTRYVWFTVPLHLFAIGSTSLNSIMPLIARPGTDLISQSNGTSVSSSRKSFSDRNSETSRSAPTFLLKATITIFSRSFFIRSMPSFLGEIRSTI
uniref:(northern house mosquito) hypothetical protein n=1 Tax=Culex pipiens TaxID=7175 RepID=A0A8D8ET14_CULPI